MTNNTNTELKEIKTYTTEELIELGKRYATHNIEPELPIYEEWNEEKRTYTVYRIIYK